MHVKVLGGSAANLAWSRSGCLLVDHHVAFDSGGLASQLSLRDQAAVDHVFLTHAHLDHAGELAFLVENVMTTRSAPLKIWAPRPVLEQIRHHLFNNQLWPDFSDIRLAGHPVIEFSPLPTAATITLGTLRIRWARTSHPVFAAGYLVEDATGAFLYSGDTGATEAIWALANTTPHLRAIFVETVFPNRLHDLALVSGHLTPAMLQEELAKVRPLAAMINVMHVKPVYRDEIAAELAALPCPWQIIAGGEEFSLDERFDP